VFRRVDASNNRRRENEDDGVFLWYTRRSMYEVLDRLAEILQEIRQDQRETRAAVDKLAAKRE
jgi:hypothetical protein